jgi:hypothetical protein
MLAEARAVPSARAALSASAVPPPGTRWPRTFPNQFNVLLTMSSST